MKYKKEKEFLVSVGCKELPHSGRSLYDHLVGTAEILIENNRPDYEVKAALFHSIYETELYKRSKGLDLSRESIIKVIGEKAESLVSIFCNLKSRTEKIINGESIEKTHINSLRWIEYSNILDQNKYSRHLVPLRIQLGI